MEIIEQATKDPTIMQGITNLVQAITNNQLTPTARLLLTTSTLIATIKDTIEDTARPLTIGASITKLATKHALDNTTGIKEFFISKGQFGFGAPGGTATALHLAQAAIETAGDLSAVILIDFENFFNSLPRAETLQQIYSNPIFAPLYRLLDFLYGQPSALLMQDPTGEYHFETSKEGVKQGDAAGTAIACIALIKPLERIKQLMKNDSTTIAATDDVTIINTHYTDTITAFDAISQDPTLKLNKLKTKILWPHNEPPPAALVEQCRQRNVELILRSAKTLGGVIGVDPKHFEDHAMQTVQKTQNKLNLLTHPEMPAQCAHQILSGSFQANFQYTASVTPPTHSQKAAELFDGIRKQIFADIHAIDIAHLQPHEDDDAGEASPGTIADFRFFSSIKKGGLGFQRAAASTHAAYFSTAIKASQICPEQYNNPADATQTFVQHLNNSLQHFKKQNIPVHNVFPQDEGKPISSAAAIPHQVQQIPAFYELPSTQDGKFSMQRNLTQHLKDQDHDDMMSRISKRSKFIIASCAPDGRWLTTPPTTYDTTFPDKFWRQAMQFHMDIPLPPSITACVCGEDLTTQTAQDHAHSCFNLKRKGQTKRHDLVNSTLISWANRHGLPAISEIPLGVREENRKRPDGTILLPSEANILITDTTIPHPTTKTNLQTAKHDTSLRQAEAAKTKKYKNLATQEEAKFLTLAISSYGFLGNSALKIVETLASEAALQLGETKSMLARDLKQHLSCANMKGNAILLMHSALLCRMRSRPMHHFALARRDEDDEDLS